MGMEAIAGSELGLGLPVPEVSDNKPKEAHRVCSCVTQKKPDQSSSE
jgi:hypothetical protein